MPTSQITNEQWLANFGARIARTNAAIRKLDRKKVSLDIQARTLELAAAKDYARNRPELWKRLDEIGMSEMRWCKQRGKGNSLTRWRRRLQLLKPGAFRRYLHNRRKVGDNGVHGLEYAVYLSKLPIDAADESATSARPSPRVVCEDGTLDRERMNLITGDCVSEMNTMPLKWYHCIITSFPYWPARRSYDVNGRPIGFGFEEWRDNQVDNVGAAMQRVLRDDGVLWVMFDDAIAMPSLKYEIQTYNRNRAEAKLDAQTGFRTQDSTYIRPEGTWLLLPFRYAMAMQDAGWFLRDIIIVDKGAQGRKESSETRTRHSYEYALMFTKTHNDYYYDQDQLRVPLAQSITSKSLIGRGVPFKHGVIHGRDFRTMSNPMGRVEGAVWHLPVNYTGDHSAAFSEEFARRALLLTCPPGGRALDPFVGSGTAAVAASKLGLQFTGIDLNPRYIEEATQRVLAHEEAAKSDPAVANGNLASVTRAGD